jgi:hypothetical protein
MKLALNWHRAIKLGRFPYSIDTTEIPSSPGVYLFFRTHGDSTHPLYVGKAKNLQGRIKTQFNNLRLMTSIQAAPNGERKLIFAEFIPKPGQQIDKAVLLCEKALIRYFLAQGSDLLNIQGATIRFHEIDMIRPELKDVLPLQIKLQVK